MLPKMIRYAFIIVVQVYSQLKVGKEHNVFLPKHSKLHLVSLDCLHP